eukprot:276675-Rhodomonas_salina.1
MSATAGGQAAGTPGRLTCGTQVKRNRTLSVPDMVRVAHSQCCVSTGDGVGRARALDDFLDHVDDVLALGAYHRAQYSHTHTHPLGPYPRLSTGLGTEMHTGGSLDSIVTGCWERVRFGTVHFETDCAAQQR